MTMRPVASHSGWGALFTKQGIYEQSSTAKHKMGDMLRVGDRSFAYACAGEALYAGFLTAAPALGGATTTLQTTQAVTVAAVAGSSRIYVNALTTAQAADLFNDGWISVFDATTTGMCYMFKIKKSSALATSGVASYVDLYDEIPVALTTSDQCELITNPYKSVVINAATQAGAALGVNPISVTSGYYFWLQTYGPAAVYPEAALDIGEDVVASDTTAGAVCKRASATEGPVIGTCLHIGTASESAMVFLTLRA